jgi:Helix-turn-helix domain, rpiR family
MPTDQAPQDSPARSRHFGNALEMVREARSTLRKSDGKVADLVLTDPFRILQMSVAETAALAGVSQPTVIRFCVASGFSGYQEFKLRLAQSLALGRTATHSVISGEDALDAVADKIFEYTITSLGWARREGRRVRAFDDPPHLEGFKPPASSHRDLQALHRSSVCREGARYRGAVSVAARTRAGFVRRREELDSSAGPIPAAASDAPGTDRVADA